MKSLDYPTSSALVCHNPHPVEVACSSRFGAANVAVGRLPSADLPQFAAVTDLFDTADPWFAVRVHGRREERFADEMKRASVPCYLPLISGKKRERRREKGRRHQFKNVTKAVPYIQGYAFIAADTRAIYAAKATGIVYAIIPPAIPAKLVELLRKMQEKLAKPQPPERLMMGRVYEITSGKFLGKRGTLIKQEGDTCTLMGSILLSRPHESEFDIEMLEPV